MEQSARRQFVKRETIAAQAERILKSVESAEAAREAQRQCEKLVALAKSPTDQEQLVGLFVNATPDTGYSASQRAVSCHALSEFAKGCEESQIGSLWTYGLSRLRDSDLGESEQLQTEVCMLMRSLGARADGPRLLEASRALQRRLGNFEF